LPCLGDSDLKGSVRDGKVFGLGASNMKSGLAAFLVAGKAIRESGLELQGDLILAAVAGEISRTPIGPYQSEAYRGEGTGTIHLLTHGIQSDYAIVADRSGHSIVWAQNGVAQFKISTFGDPHAAWGVTREEKSPEASSAILKMMKVLQAVDSWAALFERAHVYASPHGPLVPKVNIGSIQGGAPFRPNYYPGVCSIYVDVRTPPELRPVQVQRELKAVLALGIEYEIEMYASKMGYEAKMAGPVINVLKKVIRRCSARRRRRHRVHASIWTDTNISQRDGHSGVQIRSRRGRWKFRSEQIDVEDIYQSAGLCLRGAGNL
jgi:acetylornithine deacetylase/succinyl-diaminopimelate desuccinylase-like protein